MTKYKAVKTQIDGITFDSKREAVRYGELKLLEAGGHISKLFVHVPFDLHVNGTKVARYIADFVYIENGRTVVEDVKGVKTPVYRLKNKMMRAEYGIVIIET